MTRRIFICSLLMCASAQAQITSLDLSNYQLSHTFGLPAAASEASAITYNWDTDTLFVVGDEGDAIVEITPAGAVVSTMTLSGFDDTEGLTYMGGGQFAIAEERIQTAYRLTYAAGGTLARSSLQSAVLGPSVGNVGLEGLSYEPGTGKFFAVKEKTVQRVMQADIDFGTGAATVIDLFSPALGVLDLSDIQVLSTVPSLIGTPDQDNLLVFSQESARLLEITRAGVILSQFDFSVLSGSAEGVTIDSAGNIYICDESPSVYVLSPIPAPASAGLLLAAAAFTARRRR